MSAVCPACAVPVVPGYVKCPKCHATLPAYASGRIAAMNTGGTTVPDRSFPMLAIVIPIGIVLAVLVFFELRSDGGDEETPVEPTKQAVQPVVQGNVQWQPSTAQQPQPAQAQPAAPDPSIAVGDLDRALRKQRLWSTVERVGSRVDVRSTKCSEAAMTSTIDAAVAALHDGGLTQLRCLAQSGAVVFERNL
jgi:hypothetical protein